MSWTTQNVPPFASQLIRAHHATLAAVARDAYPREGRGLVAVTFRGSSPTTTPELREVQYGYRPIAEYRRMIAPLVGAARTLAEGVIALVDAYDPATEMVVLVVVGPQFLTMPFTVPLDTPVGTASDGIDDLLPGLTHPLWEGEDAAFAAYVDETFGLRPQSDRIITISPTGPLGRSAVSIRDAAGAIVFVLTPDTRIQKTRIAPFVLGPLVTNPDVVARAATSNGDANMHAVTALLVRHLSPDVVRDLLAPQAH